MILSTIILTFHILKIKWWSCHSCQELWKTEFKCIWLVYVNFRLYILFNCIYSIYCSISSTVSCLCRATIAHPYIYMYIFLFIPYISVYITLIFLSCRKSRTEWAVWLHCHAEGSCQDEPAGRIPNEGGRCLPCNAQRWDCLLRQQAQSDDAVTHRPRRTLQTDPVPEYRPRCNAHSFDNKHK